MAIWIIIVSALLWFFFVCCTNDAKTEKERKKYKFTSIFFLATFVLTIVSSICFWNIYGNNTFICEKTNEIVSLQDDHNTYITRQLIGGKEVLSSDVDVESRFYYFERSKDGGIVEQWVPSKNCEIYEVEGEVPRVEYWYTTTVIDWRKNPIARLLLSQKGYKGNRNNRTTIKVYIPKDSIVKEYRASVS